MRDRSFGRRVQLFVAAASILVCAMKRVASARDVEGGISVAVLSLGALTRPNPVTDESWHMVATREVVELTRTDVRADGDRLRFDRAEFAVDGRLPHPAI